MNRPRPSSRQIGKYLVLDVIGMGSMGVVYRAQDPVAGRIVAIKMLASFVRRGAQANVDRPIFPWMKSTGNLHHKSIVNLRHKNIVTVYDSGEQDGSPYLVMEYFDGEPVSNLIIQGRSLSLLDKLDLIIQVCDALQYAHNHGILHRNIKPGEVLLMPDGTAKIDFTPAWVADRDDWQDRRFVGGVSYMSPEQLTSLSIDSRSDIFSTGVVLYQLLTGQLPFQGDNAVPATVQIVRQEPRPLSHYIPDLPQELQAAMNRALAKRPDERYQTAGEFKVDLLGIQRHLKSATSEAGGPPQNP